MILYLQGSVSDDGESIHCPLSCSTIMFVIKYCQTTYNIVFVSDSQVNISMCCTLHRQMFSEHELTFTSWKEVPTVVRNVSLPSLHQPELSLVRSGLCVLLRHIITDSHNTAPHLHMLDLLGFRQGSMKMCSEVSGFTKLCEVELPQAVSHLMDKLRVFSQQDCLGSSRQPLEITMPSAVTKLDRHFLKKCRVHNDNKIRREEVARIKQLFAHSLRKKTLAIGNTAAAQPGNVSLEEGTPLKSQSHVCEESSTVLRDQPVCNGSFVPSRRSALIGSDSESFRLEMETLSAQDSWLHIEHVTQLHHGIRRTRVDKRVVMSCDNQYRHSCGESPGKGVDNQHRHGESLGKGVDQEKAFTDVKSSKKHGLGKGVDQEKAFTDVKSSKKHGLGKGVDQEKAFTDVKSSKKHGLGKGVDQKKAFTDVKSSNNPHLGKGVDQKKAFTDVQSSNKSLTDIKSNNKSLTDSDVLEDVAALIEKLLYVDISYEHTYSEGIEMTVADLILYVYVYHLLEALGFCCASLTAIVPNILNWSSHMTSVGTVFHAGQGLGWDMESLASGLKAAGEGSHVVKRSKSVGFIEVADVEKDDDEMELSRCAKMKHKALKPEVFQVLQRFETARIKPVTGERCGGDHVPVDWDTLPAAVHPREGDVPDNRTHRKCEQLENLLAAVLPMARAGDVVVDFCSGGGHLGILMAYLLPDCQVYLVENKEESLLKASSRLEALALGNVTMYQCNLDYFGGVFAVGVSLHACGSATDMVLQLCLNLQASFVICPCCYGSIQKTHLLTYPQSKQFTQAGIAYKDFLTLGHAADQTEVNIALEEQGRQCMNLVDTDRAQLARELGYTVTLTSLKPLSCTPKNNLLIGAFNSGRVSGSVSERVNE